MEEENKLEKISLTNINNMNDYFEIKLLSKDSEEMIGYSKIQFIDYCPLIQHQVIEGTFEDTSSKFI